MSVSQLEEIEVSELGKKVRMQRLFSRGSGRILVIALDHAIGWGVIPGIEDIHKVVNAMVEAGADALTVLRGTAIRVMPKHAGKTPFILKATTFSPMHPCYDTRVGSVRDAVRLGADAVAVGATLCGEDQAQLLSQLADFAMEADSVGMPTVTHIYPKGNLISDKERYSAKWVAYAARAAAEIGMDIVKTYYTGDPASYAEVIKACPAKVVVSGGPKLPTVKDVFVMTKDAIDTGAAGVTYGRNVWQADDPIKMVRALAHIIHDGGTVEEALDIVNS